jgi:hypothetical protein
VNFALHITRRVLVAAALIAGVAPATAAARSSAITHRFAPATDVTVSFTLPKHRTSGELIRFKVNRVSVVRTRTGTLRLTLKGRRSRGIRAGRRGNLRVVVTLSGTSGRRVSGDCAQAHGRVAADHDGRR